MACNKVHTEIVVDAVIKRAEVGKIGRTLRTRLAFAQFKVARGWEDLSIDAIEPKVEELQRAKTNFSEEILSDSSSITGVSDDLGRNSRFFLDSPIRDSAIFSDQIQRTNMSGSSSGYCKRRYHFNFHESEFDSNSRKKHCSSPPLGCSNTSYRKCHLTLSSPIKPRRQPHFTTTSGPSLSFFAGSYQNSHPFNHFKAESDDGEGRLPLDPFMFNSSPPHTPPSLRHLAGKGVHSKTCSKEANENGTDLLLFLAPSPLPVRQNRPRVSSSTPPPPPPRNLALPSSMMSTPRTPHEVFSNYGGPKTPSQAFDFSDFVNSTPSPAQPTWPLSSRDTKIASNIDHLHSNFDTVATPVTPRHPGCGMILSGELIPKETPQLHI